MANRTALIVQNRYGTTTIDKKLVTSSYNDIFFDVMIREYAISQLLKKCTGICSYNSIDCFAKKLTCPNYGINLSEWITCKPRKYKDKKLILIKILEIIAIIHAYGIVHGDLKLENIIIGKNGLFSKINVTIIGLSHANLEEYTSYDLTSPVYQEPKPQGRLSHDMWSIGIIALELFTDKILNQPPTQKVIKTLIDIVPIEIQETIKNMLRNNENDRIIAIQALSTLDAGQIQYNPRICPIIHYKMIAEGRNFASFYKRETESNGVIRKEHGLAGLVCFFQKNGTPPSYYNTYFIGMLIVLTSLFSGNCTLAWAKRKSKHSTEDLLAVITGIISDEDVINVLYMYEKADELFNSILTPKSVSVSGSGSGSRSVSRSGSGRSSMDE